MLGHADAGAATLDNQATAIVKGVLTGPRHAGTVIQSSGTLTGSGELEAPISNSGTVTAQAGGSG